VVIPHPRLHRRRFVLTPLNDIAPELVLPNQSQPIRELLAGLDDAAGVSLFDRQWMQ
jgi:2-amino-4-hydroxy-6-hydroxymethyldihydropteridine diphosphokinase